MFSKIVRAFQSANVSEGFSFNLAGESPQAGYMVSKHPAYDAERIFDHIPSAAEFTAYLQSVLDLHGDKFFVGVYVGGWMDAETGKYYLDISDNIPDLEFAKTLGKVSQQLAIFDLSTFESIRL